MKFFDIQLAKSLIFCGLLFLVGCGGADSGAPSDSTCIPLAGCSEPDIGNANTSDPNSSSNSITGLWSQDGFSGLSYMNITAAGVREGYVESSSGDNCYYKDDSRILKQISGTLYSQSYTYSTDVDELNFSVQGNVLTISKTFESGATAKSEFDRVEGLMVSELPVC